MNYLIQSIVFMKRNQQSPQQPSHSGFNAFSSIMQMLPSFSQSVSDRTDRISQSMNTALHSTVNKLGQISTNILYSIKHSELSRKQVLIDENGPSAWFLGQEYDATRFYKMLFVFRNTFWFTYRKGIKQIDSDNGWGCMIRTVQMLFAQVLKRNLPIMDTEKKMHQIIQYFSEQCDGVLSLSAVCREGGFNNRWTSSVEVLGACKRIINSTRDKFDFHVEVLSSSISYKSPAELKSSKYPLLVSLTNRVSLTNIPQDYRPHYFALMRHSSWVGSIGGVKGQALYIVGSHEERVIFLDPHYVQSQDEDLEEDTYFCKTPRGLPLGDLSPSLTFSYYFLNYEQHMKWVEWMQDVCLSHHPHVIFEVMSQESKKNMNMFNTAVHEDPVHHTQNSLEKAQHIEIDIGDGLQADNSGQFQVLE